MSYLHLFLKIVGLVLIICTGYTIYAWSASADEIEKICKRLNSSHTLEKIKKEIFDSQFTSISGPFEDSNQKYFLIYSTYSFGRYTCSLQLREGSVNKE
ncbi:hypothetical protein KCM76_14435 [Zooshikella marina]|uniref:hypothetical protein n=1 Tax=Zooshikella ganghwensis TaxID=202772 RepID=UPI001BAEAA64|nr:hypothetical protein [Zooshikella ganghwensis]MBU2707191.1 hypothetical protein [Zooshikella ganghwensis]